jgi:lysozyme family protein
MADFKQAISIVLQNEGEYVNDPADPGGETNFGISRRSYPNLDIAHLTRADAEAIYKRDFWTPLLLDQVVDQQVATKVFDTAVLTGKHRAIKLLQRAIQTAGGGIVAVDGVIGPKTIAAANKSSPQILLQSYRQLLAMFYEGLVEATPSDQKFLRGWLNRANT